MGRECNIEVLQVRSQHLVGSAGRSVAGDGIAHHGFYSLCKAQRALVDIT